MGHGISPAEVAGAQSGLNNLSATLQQIIQNKVQQQQLAQQKAQQDTANDLAQQKIDAEADVRKTLSQQFQQTAKREDARLDLERQAHDINRQMLIQKATEGILNGNQFPGDQVAPGSFGFALGNTGTQPNMVPQTMIHTLPFNGPDGKPMQIELPTPEFHAQQQADLARIQNAPAEEAKTREQQALQESEFARQIKLDAQRHADRLAEQAQENTYNNNHQQTMITAQQSELSQRLAAEHQKAIIDATGGWYGLTDNDKKKYGMPTGVTITTDSDGQPIVSTKSPADIMTNVINDMYDGKLSTDQVKKQYPKQSSLIFETARQRGVVGATQTQLDALKGLNDISRVVPNLQEMAKLRANQGAGIFGSGVSNILDKNNVNYPGLNDAGKRFKDLEQQFGQSTARIAGVLGNIRRLNQPDVELTLKSLIPDKSAASDPMNGFNKYNNFVTDIQNDFNTITNGLPDGQKAHLLKVFGATTAFPYLSKTVNQPGQNPGTPSNAQPALPGGLPSITPLTGPYRLPGQVNQ